MCRSAELTLKPLGSSPYENDKSLDSYTENTHSSQVTITNADTGGKTLRFLLQKLLKGLVRSSLGRAFNLFCDWFLHT